MCARNSSNCANNGEYLILHPMPTPYTFRSLLCCWPSPWRLGCRQQRQQAADLFDLIMSWIVHTSVYNIALEHSTLNMSCSHMRLTYCHFCYWALHWALLLLSTAAPFTRSKLRHWWQHHIIIIRHTHLKYCTVSSLHISISMMVVSSLVPCIHIYQQAAKRQWIARE